MCVAGRVLKNVVPGASVQGHANAVVVQDQKTRVAPKKVRDTVQDPEIKIVANESGVVQGKETANGEEEVAQKNTEEKEHQTMIPELPGIMIRKKLVLRAVEIQR